MSIGPVVLRPRALPFLTIVGLLLAAFFVVQAIIVSGSMVALSLLVAALFFLGAAWFFFQSRRSSVLIDTAHFIVKDGGRQTTFERQEIDNVDLSSLSGHVKMKDGSSVSLPLEGPSLVEAGVLLSLPPR